MSARRATTIAPAKINLFLELLARRSDGYHQLETVMATVDLCDHITIERNDSGQIQLEMTDGLSRTLLRSESIPNDKSNLAWVALQKLFESENVSGPNQGAFISIRKRIPAAAGLGGASSDAAAVLRLGNQLWDLGVDQTKLAEVAAEIGSDVPFFLNSSIAHCSGRGEIVAPVFGRHENRAGLTPGVVIVKPSIGFSTPVVFSHAVVPEVKRDIAATISSFRDGNLFALGKSLFNRLEQAAAKVSDWVDRIRIEFSKLQSVGHQLSGSGSSYFGIFRNQLTALRASNILRARNPNLDVYCCRLFPNPDGILY